MNTQNSAATEPRENLKRFAYEQWIKAGFIFALGLLSFAALRASGVFSVIAGWIFGDSVDIQPTDSASSRAVEKSGSMSTLLQTAAAKYHMLFPFKFDQVSTTTICLGKLGPQFTKKTASFEFHEFKIHMDQKTNSSRFSPTLVNNILTIGKGGKVILSDEMLSAFSSKGNDLDLIWRVADIRHGQFEFVSRVGYPIKQFGQKDVIYGRVRFVHDDSDSAPAFSVSLMDGHACTEFMPSSIIFCNFYEDQELRLKAYTLYHQPGPIVTTLLNESLAVIWGDEYEKKLYYADGTRIGCEKFYITDYKQKSQFQPTVVASSDGKFVAVWHSDESDGFAQKNQKNYGQFIAGRSCFRRAIVDQQHLTARIDYMLLLLGIIGAGYAALLTIRGFFSYKRAEKTDCRAVDRLMIKDTSQEVKAAETIRPS